MKSPLFSYYFILKVLEHFRIVAVVCRLAVVGAAAVTAFRSSFRTWSARSLAVPCRTVSAATVIAVTARPSVTCCRARSAFWLDIAFRLFDEGFAGKSHLVCLRVDLERLDIHFISYAEDIFDLVGLAPVYLRNVEQSLLAWKNLDECSEFKDGYDLAAVYLSHFRHCTYTVDPVESLVH